MSDKTRSTRMTRREFLGAMAIFGGGAALAACAPKPTATPPAEEPTKPPTAEPYGGPLAVEQGTIELQIREPGDQRAGAFEEMVKTLNELYPETEWDLVYDMQNWDYLRPRFIAGDPPDGCWLSNGGDPFGLLDEDLLMDLTPLMEAPAYGQEDIKFKDIFLPGTLEPGQKDGKQYLVPKNLSTRGLWYSRALIEEYGWGPLPDEPGGWKWDDFTALMKEIKAAGLSPILSGGPGNAGSFLTVNFYNFAFQAGGEQLFKDLHSLKPGAWNSEAILAALARCQEMFQEEYIDPKWSAIDWKDADTLIFQKKAVFKPDGHWFPASNKGKTPEGFNLGFTPNPTIPEVQGSPKIMGAIAEPSWIVPKEATHPRGGMEFIRLWNSKPFSVVFAEVSGDILPISDSGEGADWDPATEHLLSYFNQCERFYPRLFHAWYAPLNSAVGETFTEMALGNVTIQEAADTFEAAAEEVRNDPEITKRTLP
jgi:N-acetylglucosamine transport system substrate-binding protein